MMMRAAYPENWECLAQACKERDSWTCQHCGVKQYEIRTSKKGNPYFIYLHAAHVNHDQGNPDPELITLCITCHSRFDYQHKQREARVRLECLKHLRLLIQEGAVKLVAPMNGDIAESVGVR
jgi:hypothetical protein